MKFGNAKQAYQQGLRDGLRGVLAIGRYDQSPPWVTKRLGSMVTDRAARYEDVRSLRCDVQRAEPVALHH